MEKTFNIKEWGEIPNPPSDPDWKNKTYKSEDPLDETPRASEPTVVEGISHNDNVHYTVANRPIIEVLDNTLINDLKLTSLANSFDESVLTGFELSDTSTDSILNFSRGSFIKNGLYYDYEHSIYEGIKYTIKDQSGEEEYLSFQSSFLDSIPTMTSDTSPSGHCYKLHGLLIVSSGSAYEMFDDNDSTSCAFESTGSAPISIVYEFSTPKIIKEISFLITGGVNNADITSLSIEGSNTSSTTGFTTLYSQGATTFTPSSTKQYFYLNNNESYLYYRLYIVVSDVSSPNKTMTIKEIEMSETYDISHLYPNSHLYVFFDTDTDSFFFSKNEYGYESGYEINESGEENPDKILIGEIDTDSDSFTLSSWVDRRTFEIRDLTVHTLRGGSPITVESDIIFNGDIIVNEQVTSNLDLDNYQLVNVKSVEGTTESGSDHINILSDLDLQGNTIYNSVFQDISFAGSSLPINVDIDMQDYSILNINSLEGNGSSDITVDSNIDLSDNSIKNCTDIIKKNWIMNGNFDVWQRGVSFSNTVDWGASTNFLFSYTADRWLINWNAGWGSPPHAMLNVSRQEFSINQTDVPDNPRYFLNVTRTQQPGNTATVYISHRIEDGLKLAGKKCYLGFYAKKTWATSGQFSLYLKYYNGVNYVQTAYSNTISLTGTSWNFISLEIDMPELDSDFSYQVNGNFLELLITVNVEVNYDFQLAHFQLNIGEKCPFEIIPFNDELKRCERYFEKSYDYNDAPGTATSIGKEWAWYNHPNKSINVGESPFIIFDFAERKRDTPIMNYYTTEGTHGKIRWIYDNGSWTLTSSDLSSITDINNTGEKSFGILNNDTKIDYLIPIAVNISGSWPGGVTPYLWSGALEFQWTAESELYYFEEEGYESGYEV